MVNSRNKGKSGEYEVIAILTENLSGGADKLEFKRDIEQYRQGDLGDVLCSDPAFPFVVEVKRYRQGVNAQPAWWDQVCTAAEACHKLPLLVYRYDRMPWRWRFPVAAIVGMADYVPAGDISEQYDWRYAMECDTDTAMMIIREHLADV
jgi:hypothetical protein